MKRSCREVWIDMVIDRGIFITGAIDSAKNHKRQRRKRLSVTAKREKSQTPKLVWVRLSEVQLG